MGQAYYLMDDYKSALPRLEKGMAISLHENISDNAAGFAALLSSSYLRQNNMPMAKKYVDIAKREAHKSGDIANSYTVYRVLTDYYKQTGNASLALLNQDSMLFFKDSLDKINDVHLKFSAEIAIVKERASHQEKIYEAERSRHRIILIGSLLSAFLVLLVILLLFNRRQLKYQKEQQQSLARQQLAQNELNEAKKQLLVFTKSIVQKNKLIEQASSEIGRITAAFHQLQSQQQETRSFDVAKDQALNRMHKVVFVTHEDWDNFTEVFNKVYPGFFIRLKQKIPHLSPAEKRFLALAKLNLDTREMAAMLAVGTDAVRQSRSRLKKKLSLNDNTSLKEVIESV